MCEGGVAQRFTQLLFMMELGSFILVQFVQGDVAFNVAVATRMFSRTIGLHLIGITTFLYLTAFALDLILHDSAALHLKPGWLPSNTTLIKTPRELEDQQQKNLTDL